MIADRGNVQKSEETVDYLTLLVHEFLRSVALLVGDGKSICRSGLGRLGETVTPQVPLSPPKGPCLPRLGPRHKVRLPFTSTSKKFTTTPWHGSMYQDEPTRICILNFASGIILLEILNNGAENSAESDQTTTQGILEISPKRDRDRHQTADIPTDWTQYLHF